MGSSLLLAMRAALWAVVLPGFFAFYLPWRYFGVGEALGSFDGPVEWLGTLVATLGTVLLAACIVEFARSGRGTLSPVDPPRRLVVRGLYRYVRNPMYLSVTLVVLGEVLLTGSTALLAYWALWFLAANLFVLAYEEPTLHAEFGEAYEEYTRAVGRWIPRLRPH
jgi:protein-S-isoprenylcysteine O-methyltransferase Ste14